jgi:hypothetical protein
MPGTTTRKRKTLSKDQARRQAAGLFKHGVPTSQWTKEDAVNYFKLNKQARTVFRPYDLDKMSVEWYLNDNDEVEKLELVPRKV